MTDHARLHALTWAWWALCAVTVVQLAPAPTSVALVIAIATLAVETSAVPGPFRRAFPVLVLAATAFVLVRVLLTAITTHAGTDVLFTLPELTLPPLLGGFTVGGTVEAPVVLRAASEGFAVVGVVAVFAAFNAVISHHELVRMAPRAFHELGLIVTVALAFVPSTMAAIGAVREADRARTGGRVVRRGRVLRLVVPVLESGMEHAIHLAESMDARGFGHLAPTRAERRAGWIAVVALAALAGAFAALVARATALAAVLGGLGSAALLAAVAIASRASRRPRYRSVRPGRRDLVVAVLVTLAPIGVASRALAGDAALRWDVGAQTLPSFSPLAGAALLLLLAPVLVRRRDGASAPTVSDAGATA